MDTLNNRNTKKRKRGKAKMAAQKVKVLYDWRESRLEEKINDFLDWLIIAPISIDYTVQQRRGFDYDLIFVYVRYNPEQRLRYLQESGIEDPGEYKNPDIL